MHGNWEIVSRARLATVASACRGWLMSAGSEPYHEAILRATQYGGTIAPRTTPDAAYNAVVREVDMQLTLARTGSPYAEHGAFLLADPWIVDGKWQSNWMVRYARALNNVDGWRDWMERNHPCESCGEGRKDRVACGHRVNSLTREVADLMAGIIIDVGG